MCLFDGRDLTDAGEPHTINTYAHVRALRCKWTPGTDHAGIATQVVVEKMLARQGHTNISRDQLLAACHKWQNKCVFGLHLCARTLSCRRQTDIREQLQRMCPLLDWRNEYFTMNEVSVQR
jgi:valyl-tRNA synthetase